MADNIKSIFQKNKKVYYFLLKVKKGLKKPNQIGKILLYSKRFKLNFTNKNKDKIFYIIRKEKGDGFFANFTFVLDHLIIADEKGWIPIVDMENHKTLYSEEKKIFQTHNAWEYYFEQLSDYTLEEVYSSRNIIFCEGAYPYYKALYYNRENNELPSKEKINELNNYIQRYIKLKPHIKNKLKIEYNKLDKFNKVLGVHIRGTDMITEGGHHPIPAGLKKMIEKINNALCESEIDGILVCSDEEETVEKLKDVFGELIITTNVLRAPSNSNIGIHRDNSLGENRENHRYLLGEEVLIDMLLLSKCDLLLCGPSNVAYTAMIFNNNNYEKIYFI